MVRPAEYKALMQRRSGIYRLLSQLFGAELKEDLRARLQTVAVSSVGQPDMARGIERMIRVLRSADGSPDELSADYAKTFLAAGEYQGNAAYPYESVYTSPRRLVMQDAWDRVRAVYAEDGLVVGSVPSDWMEDHIAMELEYMAVLSDRLAEGSDPRLIARQKEFLADHLLNWVPAFLSDIDKYARGDFYKGAADVLRGFLSLEQGLLEELSQEDEQSSASFCATETEMDAVLAELRKEFRIVGPRLSGRTGSKGREIVRFGDITSVREIVTDRQTDFSAKEIYNPIMQTMFFFEGDNSRENITEERETLIIAHPCDINAIRRLDRIFLQNGKADAFYERRRSKMRFILLECGTSFENCTCVSMHSNRTDDYAAAIALRNGKVYAEVRDASLLGAFSRLTSAEYTPSFVEENPVTVTVPDIQGREDVKLVHALPFWQEYNDRCIGCAGCNTVCPTCSCFDTVDVIYSETSLDGERRRVWSGCMLDTFTMTAGGGRTRRTPGENMRFKVMHKMYDYRARFHLDENMCVGCGRCVARCPKEIDFRDTVNRLSQELARAKEGKE